MSKEKKYIGPRKTYVKNMFDRIAKHYDFLNHFFSLGIDFYWRKKARKCFSDLKNKSVLDIACGTGDMAIEMIKANPQKIFAIDLSQDMIEIGRKKVTKKGLSKKIEFKKADSENIPFEVNSFDAITIAFGIRNFENPLKGLEEMRRVLKPNGKLVILELTHPKIFPIKQLYHLYSKILMPEIGGLISGERTAYKYLPKSVKKFPEGKKFTKLMKEAGFENSTANKLTFGIATIYIG